MSIPRPILIAGPTASGKSALGMQLARHCNGIVINADSLQVYRELRVLTARPTPEDEARARHALYGHVPAATAYSVARWVEDVGQALETAREAGLRPVIVGGTGLYFKALLEGLSPIPPIPEAIRQHWRSQAGRLGAPALHARLASVDPEMAARLGFNDAQRVTRALEVLEATGRSLRHWQRQPGTPRLEPAATIRLLVMPPRDVLRARCDQRFDRMMAAGALEEVRQLAALGLDRRLPALQAIGVRPLLDALEGRIPLAAAIVRGKAETRQYLKRQTTWLKSHMIAWKPVHTEDHCQYSPTIMQLIDG